MNFWCGEKIKLRRATEIDFVLCNSEASNAETQKLYDKIELPENMASVEETLKKQFLGDDFLFAIETLDGTLVGQLAVFDCDKRMGTFKFGQLVLPPYQGKGYATEAVKIVLDYYFNHLRYHKANVYIYDCNEKSQKFHKKLGFVKEGVLRETAFFDGEYHDCIYYGLIDREFNK